MAFNMRFCRLVLNPGNLRLLRSQSAHKQFQLSVINQSRCITSASQRGVFLSSTSKQQDEHKYSDDHRKRMGRYYSLIIGSGIGMIGSLMLIYKKLNVKAEEVNTIPEIEAGSLHKSDAGFKERKIIEYENRIRSYSTPDKIFRYFASLQDTKTGTIYMNPEDFVRALTPDTMQPKGLGLDQFKKFDNANVGKYESKYFGEESIFHSLGQGGLISFSDYIFLLTVLGTSARHINIAFKMFDLNGDGEVCLEEFKKVRALFLNMTSTGSRHRDRKTTGNVLNDQVNEGLAAYFFGEDGKGVLTSDEFIKFKKKLQEEVMFLEFNSFCPKNNSISERQFADILLTYANFQNTKRNKIMKRIQRVYGEKEKRKGVRFQDYLDFFSFLLNIRDVEMALSFHTIAGQPVDPATFKQVAKTVTGIDLNDHLVDIVFCIFDENEDGQLSNKEFVSVMKDKMFRGLNKPKDTGFTRLMSAIVACSKQHIIESWFPKDHTH